MKNNQNIDMMKDSPSNWMAEEIRYEATVGTWRFEPGAKALQRKHEDNCEAEELRDRHTGRHAAVAARESAVYRNNTQQVRTRPQANNPRQASVVITVSIIMFVVYFLIMFIAFLL